MNLLRHCLFIGIWIGLALLTAGLLILVHRVILVSPWWQLAEIGLILIIYGAVELLTRMNTLSFLRHIRSYSQAEEESPSFSVYEPTHASTPSTLAGITVVSPALALKLIDPNQLDPPADLPIYLHQDLSYSQN